MNKEFYIKEPLFEFNIASRELIKIITQIVYLILIAFSIATIFFVKSLPSLKALGILVSLFLLDRAFHLNRGRRPLYKPQKGRENLIEYCTPKSIYVLEQTFRKSLILKQDFFLLLLKELLKVKDIKRQVFRLELPLDKFLCKLEEYLNDSQKEISKEQLKENIEEILKRAYILANDLREDYIEPRDIFAALPYEEDSYLSRLFSLFSIFFQDLQELLFFSKYETLFRPLSSLPVSLGGLVRRPYFIRHRVVNRAWTSRPTPTLDKYSFDFTDLARAEKIGFLIGHKKEYARLIEILSRPSNNSVLLIGEEGAGKETLIAHLAYNIVKDKVPSSLFDKRVVCLSFSSLMSSASFEDYSQRIKKIVNEIIEAGNIILYIPGAEDLVKAVSKQGLTAADLLLPAIKSSVFPVIGATYPKEYKQFIEPNSEFKGAFEKIRIEEISEEEARNILICQSIIWEKQSRIKIQCQAIRKAVNLAKRYFRPKLLPSSARDLLKQALDYTLARREKIVNERAVVEVAQTRTGIPLEVAAGQEAKILLNLEKFIHKKYVNQEEAVQSVSSCLREYRAGLKDKNRPIAVFLFVGPTGVGKTYLSKILAKVQFGKEEIIRFDMSEFQTKESIYRFIGSPDGKTSGALTEAVLRKPYSLVLLDEFEKTHPDILNLFLQVFDEGRLTDSLGRTVSFKDTIIIATSNAESNFIKENIEKGKKIKDFKEEFKKRLTRYFKPELLNRFSNIIIFRELKFEEIEKIARIQLQELARFLKKNQGLKLGFEEDAIKKVAQLGYDPVYGARPLASVISSKIKDVLAEKILKKEIGRGNKINIGIRDNEFEFKIEE